MNVRACLAILLYDTAYARSDKKRPRLVLARFAWGKIIYRLRGHGKSITHGLALVKSFLVCYTFGMAADEEKTKEEEAIKNLCQSESAKHLKKFSDFLRKVALDDGYRGTTVRKVKNPVTGYFEDRSEELPVATNVRVSAAKIWKELIADKAIGDVKEKAKASRSEGLDIKAAIEEIAKKKQSQPKTIEEEL